MSTPTGAKGGGTGNDSGQKRRPSLPSATSVTSAIGSSRALGRGSGSSSTSRRVRVAPAARPAAEVVSHVSNLLQKVHTASAQEQSWNSKDAVELFRTSSSASASSRGSNVAVVVPYRVKRPRQAQKQNDSDTDSVCSSRSSCSARSAGGRGAAGSASLSGGPVEMMKTMCAISSPVSVSPVIVAQKGPSSPGGLGSGSASSQRIPSVLAPQQKKQQQQKQPPPPRAVHGGTVAAAAAAASTSLFEVLPHSSVVSNRGEYIRHQKLGEGCFGSTWLVEWRPTKTMSATQQQKQHQQQQQEQSGFTKSRRSKFFDRREKRGGDNGESSGEDSPKTAPSSRHTFPAAPASAPVSPPNPPAQVSALSCCKERVSIRGSRRQIPFECAFVLKVQTKKQKGTTSGGDGTDPAAAATRSGSGPLSSRVHSDGTDPAVKEFASTAVVRKPNGEAHSVVVTPSPHPTLAPVVPSGSFTDSSDLMKHETAVQKAAAALANMSSSISSSRNTNGSANSSVASSCNFSPTEIVGSVLEISTRAQVAVVGSPGALGDQSGGSSNSGGSGGSCGSSNSRGKTAAAAAPQPQSDTKRGDLTILDRQRVREALAEHAATNAAREAHEMRNMAHPNIVAFVDMFEDATNEYLVMEYIDGGDLRQEVLRRQSLACSRDDQGAGPFSVNSALFLWVQAALGCEYLHRHNVLHRDLKTANLLCSRKWIVKIADFGFSRTFDKDIDEAGATTTAKGTPHYMAPECFLRKGNISGKADVWALGCILYELLSLQRPFERGGAEDEVNLVAKRVVKEDPPPINSFRAQDHEVSPELEALLRSMLHKDHAKRPSIKEVLRTPIMTKALDTFLNRLLRAAEGSSQAVDMVLSDMAQEHIELVRDLASSPESRRRQQRERRVEVMARSDSLGSLCRASSGSSSCSSNSRASAEDGGAQRQASVGSVEVLGRKGSK